MKMHELKTWLGPFAAVIDGRKRFEFRSDDRGFEVGDVLRLREWSLDAGYTGRSIDARVTYIVHGPSFGVPEGFCVMSIEAGVCVVHDGRMEPSP